MEKVQRLLAALVGFGWSAKALLRTFHDPDPRAQQAAVILFRVGICGLVLFVFLKRAAGKRMEATTWNGLACFFVVGIWNATGATNPPLRRTAASVGVARLSAAEGQ
jgi:hypothetical protein